MQYHGEEGVTLQKCLIKNSVYFVNVQAQLTIQVFQKQDPEKIIYFFILMKAYFLQCLALDIFITVYSKG